MGLTNVSGVFSRFFVVGFFAPAFAAVVVIGWLFGKVEDDTDVLVAGGIALVVGLVLSGLRSPIWFTFEGDPGLAAKGGHSETAKGPFGRATHEYRDYVERHWGVDAFAAWPLVESMLSDGERQLHYGARADAHFFLNSCLGAFVIAVAFVVDAFSVSGAATAARLGLAALFLVFVPLLYLAAAGAASRWGELKEAAVALHRFELLELLGFGTPAGDEAARRLSESLKERLARARAR